MVEDAVNLKLKELEMLQPLHLKKAMAMMKADNSALFPLDLLAIAVFNRSMSLSSGFSLLIRNKNFISAAPLIRLQLDNALRFFATSLVEEPHKLATEFIGGTPIKNFKDAQTNKKLDDRYLVETLGKRFNWIENVYKNASGYIHLSEKHFFNSATTNEKKKMSLSLSVSADDKLITDEERIEAINAMIEITKIVLWLLDSWTHNKENPGLKSN